MIISKEALVKSSKFYENIGYETNEKYIMVRISDIPSGSRCIIDSKCDYCGELKSLSYKDYNNNIKKGGKFSCSISCGVIKSKETTLKKWGVESTNQLESKKNKIKQILIDKWGVNHVSKIESVSKKKSDKMKLYSDEVSYRVKSFFQNLNQEDITLINLKRKNTNLEKWGIDNPSKLEEIKNKTKETVYKKWGGFTLSSDYLKSVVMKTNLEKWGFETPSKSDIIKDKTKKSNLEKWGFEYPSQSEEIKDKIKTSNLEKWGVNNIMLSEEFRKSFNITNQEGYIKYIGSRNYEFFCNNCNNVYIIDYDNFYKRTIRKVNTCTICCEISSSTSIKEYELFEFIESTYKGEIIQRWRDGLEIDIFLPDLKIGFEFNGLYWHSSEWKGKTYHIDKTNYFDSKGIRIIHIWEDDWDNRKEILKSQIKNWICVSNEKIFARRCHIKEIIDTKEYKNFLNNNHIQGYIRSTIKIGLYYGNELVSVMTFDNLEGRNKMEDGGWNLSRFCNIKNKNIVGSASKLLKYFINKWNPSRIISFADLDWSKGDIYFKLEFKLKNQLKPDYKYIVNGIRVNKQRLSKKKLLKLGFSKELTENKITEEMGLPKIWNCGQLKFELNLN